MNELVAMPYVRESHTLKQFLELDKQRVEEEETQRRNQAALFNRFSMNPFAQQQPLSGKESPLGFRQNFDGRRSMSTMAGKDQVELLFPSQEEQQPRMIQELEDEDISSIASKYRNSQAFEGGSSRPSMFSMKGGDGQASEANFSSPFKQG